MREINDGSAARSIQTVGGTGEQRQFTIGINGYAFRTLVDSLYSDKVGSVIREIIANAVDAHAMLIAKGGKPSGSIKVNLPTMFSKTFSVRDFGPGMDHEFVMGLYSQLFHSEKKGTNVATGMFGLGSKSPFSISDQFEVRVYTAHGDKSDTIVERVYSTFIDGEGIPTIELKGTYNKPLTVGTGVMISIPVSDARVSEFERALSKQALAFFDKDIAFNRVLSASAVTAIEAVQKDIEKVSDCCYFVRAKNSTKWDRGDLYIRQGTAVYPVDRNKVTIPHHLQQIVNLFTRQGTQMLFDAPIGTFNVTPSREAVAYDTASTAAITKIVHKGIADGLKTYEDRLKDAKTLRDAYVITATQIAPRDAKGRIALTALSEAYGMRDIVDAVMAKKLGKNRHELQARLPIDTANMLPGTKLYTANYNEGASIYSFSTTKRHTADYGTVVFVLNNYSRLWEARVQKWLADKCPYNTNGGSLTVVVIRTHRGNEQKIIDEIDTEIVTHVIPETDLPEIKDAAGLPVPTKPIRKRYLKDDVYHMATTTHSASGYKWEDTKRSADTSQAGYYVVRNGSKSDNMFGTVKMRTSAGLTRETIDTTDMLMLVSMARKLGLIDATPVYRVTQTQEKIALEDGWAWLNITDLIIERIADVEKLHKKAARAGAVREAINGSEAGCSLLARHALAVLTGRTRLPNPAQYWDYLDEVQHSDLVCLSMAANMNERNNQFVNIPFAPLDELVKAGTDDAACVKFLNAIGKKIDQPVQPDTLKLATLSDQMHNLLPLVTGTYRPADMRHVNMYTQACFAAKLPELLVAVGVNECAELIKEIRKMITTALKRAKDTKLV